MPNMSTVAVLVLTLEPLAIGAQNQDGVLSNINTQRRESVFAPRWSLTTPHPKKHQHESFHGV